MINKKLSIITNFGCKNNCDYCVWKSHSFKDILTSVESTDWDRLEEMIKVSPERISISGGGDPFYDYENNKEWWARLISILDKYDKKISVHTRMNIPDEKLKIDKLVWSFDTLEELCDFKSDIPTRIAKVITKDTTQEEIKGIIDIGNERDYQITFKQLHGREDNNNFLLLKNKYKDKTNVKFLTNKDYNIYFMPDNNIYINFVFNENVV